GQRELLRAVAGVLPAAAGRCTVTAPVAFIPEDRTTEGLLPSLSLTANVALGLAHGAEWGRGLRLDWAAAREATVELLAAHDVRAASADVPAGSLSGGNQQKLLIGRALALGPAVLVAENPTRGLDVQATRTVHDRLREAAAAGLAVLLHSTDLDEVLAIGSRVVVLASGRLLVPATVDRATVGALMLRGTGGADA
ncbi:MAG: hypothetical protein MUC69_08725, partial [Gemmatimonadales bacterium]|nr:hypothetical protein [Gemmatimonadales bacterium]